MRIIVLFIMKYIFIMCRFYVTIGRDDFEERNKK